MVPGLTGLYRGPTEGGMRVLICDDEADIRLLYRNAFEQHGVQVVEAENGADCIIVAGRLQPDLIVLDVFMPVRDGLSILPELLECAPDSSVVIITAHAAVEVLERARAQG